MTPPTIAESDGECRNWGVAVDTFVGIGTITVVPVVWKDSLDEAGFGVGDEIDGKFCVRTVEEILGDIETPSSNL